MAVFAPLILIPGMMVGGYYSWKITYNTATNVIHSGKPSEHSGSTIGAVLGATSVFSFAGAVALHNSRNMARPKLDRSKPAPVYTTEQFIKTSKSAFAKGFAVWCLSAVAAAAGSYFIAKISSQEENSVEAANLVKRS
uniref:Uncharacterized protein n=1 Tax=Vannella robusta TaxID=1487602 RepID=A0A7S4IH16_9EUKA|mmetsp:Transcript_25694/g.32764  ORF Transcript_25694/g.32764 Transcript_25694/m.32764 type:complete len:138 (+) Transcript_25694:25-438(+)